MLAFGTIYGNTGRMALIRQKCPHDVTVVFEFLIEQLFWGGVGGCLTGHRVKSHPWPGEAGKHTKSGICTWGAYIEEELRPSLGKSWGLRNDVGSAILPTLGKRQLGCPLYHMWVRPSPFSTVSNTDSGSTSGSHQLAACACLQLISLREALGNGMSQSVP